MMIVYRWMNDTIKNKDHQLNYLSTVNVSWQIAHYCSINYLTQLHMHLWTTTCKQRKMQVTRINHVIEICKLNIVSLETEITIQATWTLSINYQIFAELKMKYRLLQIVSRINDPLCIENKCKASLIFIVGIKFGTCSCGIESKLKLPWIDCHSFWAEKLF